MTEVRRVIGRDDRSEAKTAAKLGACVAVRFGNVEEIGYEARRTQNYVSVWLIGTYDVKLCSIPKCRVRGAHRHAYTMPECEL